jgi:NAD(P)-dependent dehydrogenase (short-subunit alcohol dehydrogenase family)
MLVVTGMGSTIVQELQELLPDEQIVRVDANAIFVPQSDRYLLCAGVIRPKMLSVQTEEEVAETLNVNFVWPAQMCELILSENMTARICVIGSESGYSGSFDMAYAGAKAAMHMFIETSKLQPRQQLVGIAPSIIEDSGMTNRRQDVDNLSTRRKEHPKGRFLEAMEVAKLVKHVLYEDRGYLSGL